jgi:hypothetical protein
MIFLTPRCVARGRCGRGGSELADGLSDCEQQQISRGMLEAERQKPRGCSVSRIVCEEHKELS